MVHFVSVGQGDAVAINLPDDKIMLIDCGPESCNTNYTQYLQDTVLNTKRDKVIDYLVLTHSDLDHIGGALRLLQNFAVKTIFMPVMVEETDFYLEFKSIVDAKNYNQIQIENGLNLSTNNYKIDFYVSDLATEENDLCPIIKLNYLNKTFLFTGDISSAVETEMVNKIGNTLDCDVLKVAHHGSKYSTSMDFLTHTTPQFAVISCGQNSYGHPTAEVVNNLQSCGANILRTDISGNIAFVVNNQLNLKVLSGSIKTTGMYLDIRILIVVLDCVILINGITLFLRKSKKKKHAR
ncbi:MAG: MBL fold metallo-hydrolase [Clostridia bacterium]|nr:MBL fold metallo-hydrolase [Clostridia bacterium]